MSTPGKLSNKDWTKVATGAGIAVLGICGAAVVDQLSVWTRDADLTTYQGIGAAAVCSVLANLLRKWMTETK